MSNTYYRAFEDRHRGTRDLIKQRLRAYTPFVQPLLIAYPLSHAVDLGCGRGEWLELLGEIGYTAQGVDLDEGMLEACHRLGFKVQLGDAIAFLKGLPDQSQTVVSAFHVVEHIAFEQLQELATQALRVLKPGGLLIMETPNPENIVVATSNFYVDPSHQRPIPPLLLGFVADHAGFVRTKTVRLQENKELLTKSNVNLQEVFAGVSPDFAVVAQKGAADSILALTEKAFIADYGLDLVVMLKRWDDHFERLELKVQKTENQALQAQRLAQQANSVSQQAQTTAESLHAHAQNLERRLQEVQHHYTWRITAPMRWLEMQLKRLHQEGLAQRAKALIKKILRKIIGLIEKKPGLRRWMVALCQKVGIDKHLKKISRVISLQTNESAKSDASNLKAMRDAPLSPCAQKIHNDLLQEIGRIQKGQD